MMMMMMIDLTNVNESDVNARALPGAYPLIRLFRRLRAAARRRARRSGMGLRMRFDLRTYGTDLRRMRRFDLLIHGAHLRLVPMTTTRKSQPRPAAGRKASSACTQRGELLLRCLRSRHSSPKG